MRSLRIRSGYELGVNPYTMPWLRPVDEIEFNGEPPFVFLRFIDKDLEDYSLL